MSSAVISSRRQQEDHGKDVWLNSTFGGEKYFSLILPAAPFDLQLGFDTLLATPRSQRFTRWGVINDPDCTDGDASSGFDRCVDPHATGVVGIRKFDNPLPVGPRVLVGVACASCHAGLDPARPPADPNHPGWENIHLTVGNQYLDLWRALSPASDPSAEADARLKALMASLAAAAPAPAAAKKKPAAHKYTAAEVAAAGDEAKRLYGELRAIIWPNRALDAAAQQQLETEFKKQALKLYSPSDARKYHRERRFSTVDASW